MRSELSMNAIRAMERIRVRLGAVLLLGLLYGAIAPVMARAEGTCGRNTPVVADGRMTQSVIPANTTFWYYLSATAAGRSYSVEFRTVLDRPPSALLTLAVM